MNSLASAVAYLFPTAMLMTATGILTAAYIHIHAVESGRKRLHIAGTCVGAFVMLAIGVAAYYVASHVPLATATPTLTVAAWATGFWLFWIGPLTASYENARAAYELAEEYDDDWTTIYPVEEEAVSDE
jgi:hypothetical protein